ncbi:partner and localizer of BRCA2 [Labrus mixtus]|uniref:partner and localizer of BRCA2 n=1 Tax=Labrus mixtus TaxID=508554 RepID=UPI0029C0C1F9|nr:partner and localizer of BRCA2 [Labrus mixtus]
MEINVGDIPHCEEQLKTTLHCDDKEKLRRKLALLQREYLRTAQRLQRAERSEVVRRHVRSRIEQQNHQDKRDPEVTSNPCHNPTSLSLNVSNGTASGVPQCQESNGGTTDTENPRRSQVIRFLLPSDDACPQTPDSSNDSARGHRPSPALRLRSRSSRLRWERRSAAEAGRSTNDTEEGLEQSEKMESPRTIRGEERGTTEGAEVVYESEELISSARSDSPSLLLPHWNTCGETEAGNMEGQEAQGQQEHREKESEGGIESTFLPLTCRDPALYPGGRKQTETKNGKGKETEGENGRSNRDGALCEDSSEKDTEPNAAVKTESARSHHNSLEVKETCERVGAQQNVKGVGILDSCTLVEGLLFPAEYYVRTTRRMTSSHSQPDMQAVIHTQLGIGRPRRSRGNGRGLNKRTHNREGSDKLSQTSFSSPTTASPAVGPCTESPAVGTPTELISQSSSEISDQVVSADTLFSPKVTAVRPARGRRRRRGRGRGRGRPQTPRSSFNLDTSNLDPLQIPNDLQLTSSLVSASPSLHGPAVGSQPLRTQGEAVSVTDQPEPAYVYPIFLKSSGRTNRTTQLNGSSENRQSLLLPSSSPSQTSLLPLPSLSSGPLANNLINFDVHQDFHLPDDQFASLKLHKLRRVAVESGIEHFTSPSYNTRSSTRHCVAPPRSPVMPLPMALSLTPVIKNSTPTTQAERVATQSGDLQNVSTQQPLIDESSDQENPKKQKTEILQPESQTHTCSTESASVVQEFAADSADQYEEEESDLKTDFAESVTGTVKDDVFVHSYELQTKDSSVPLLDEQTDCPGVAQVLRDERSPTLPTHHQTKTDEENVVKTLFFDSPRRKTSARPSTNLTACSESPVQRLNVRSPARDLNESPECPTSPPRVLNVQAQLLFSPLLASAPGRFTTPHSSLLATSPSFPSLGPTPYPAPAALPLSSSASAPALTLPPSHSPSTQALSPPVLSPRLSPTCVPPSQPPNSPAPKIQVSPGMSERVEPATCPSVSSIHHHGLGVQAGMTIEDTAEGNTLRCVHTLKAPAGGCLVDVCCLPGPSSGFCVAAAGKWAVCLWSQTAASDWSLTHTWAFNEPVINVFSVPDAAGLMCVTLGQLEIKEVRMLSCSSLSQVLLCAGPVQAVVCVSRSRVVTSSHSACGSTLQVFTLLDSGSTWSSQLLVSPGVCVGAIAPVNGLLDALIGTDEGGSLLIWNLKTGQLLRRITLTDGLSHTACLRGYSYCGVLFVLLQHQFLTSLEEAERETEEEDQIFSEEEVARRKSILFSLVAVNPLTGKSVVATRLYPPKAWSGRLCEADVSSSSVVGLSQSGCVCVWELLHPGGSRMVWSPESEGWQLARWGGEGTLVTGHHNGDVSLHCYYSSQTLLSHPNMKHSLVK